MTSRRVFLTGLLAASTTPDLTWADVGNPSYLAAAKLPDNSFALFGLSETGEDVFEIPLPARGHAAAVHPIKPEAVAFARRPGRFALVIDCTIGQLIHKLDAPKGKHFYGHGSFIHGGEILCTTENDIETGNGIIGLWARSQNYRRIGEFYSGGIGPHEVKTMPDDRTIVVANGGIKTHPETGREKLNLETMRSNLSFIKGDGSIDTKIEIAPELHKNSIRHLDVSANGMVAFGMQWQGDISEAPDLVGLVGANSETQFFGADLNEQLALNGYIGSVAISTDAKAIGVTAPKGNRAHLYKSNSGLSGVIKRRDICGIATKENGFITTDGNGGVFNVDDTAMTLLTRKPRSWDNHLVKVSV